MTELLYADQIPLCNSPLGVAIMELGTIVLFVSVTTWLIYRGLVRLFEWLDVK